MSQKANPTLVGGFVAGAAALLILGIAFLGSGGWWSQNTKIVTYFEGSVQGLNVGSPVTVRGVRIGSVTSIRLELNVRKFTARIPVYMEIERTKVRYIDGVRPDDLTQELISRGLRAQLTMQSFVTGQLAVDLDFHPGTPGPNFSDNSDYLEVPAIKSQIENLEESFDQLPLKDIAQAVLKTVQDIDAIVDSPDTKSAIRSLASSTVALQSLLDQLQQQVGPVTTSVRETSDSLRQTLVSAQGAITNLNTLLKNASGTLTQLSRTTDGTLKTADSTLSNVNSLVAPGSRQRADLDEILRNLATTSGTLKSLANALDRNPNALIIGNKR